MSYFPQTVATALAGSVVRAATLVHFAFVTKPMRLWLGHGLLMAGGQAWSGLGELGSISGIESALGGTAPQVTFGLSGVDPNLVSAALASAAEVKNRDATIYLQFFDEAMQTLDNPYAIWAGSLDMMTIKADGPGQRTVEVTAETLFARRAIPPFGYLTDRDQQRLFPGDRGLEQVPAMANKSVVWPAF